MEKPGHESRLYLANPVTFDKSRDLSGDGGGAMYPGGGRQSTDMG